MPVYLTAMQLLLGYLSPNRDLWETELAESRSKYSMLKEETLTSPVRCFVKISFCVFR